MTCFGVDPDMHATAIACLGDIWSVGLISIPKTIRGREAMIEMCKRISITLGHHLCNAGEEVLAVEGQQFHTSKNSPFEDIGHLASITGAVIAIASGRGLNVLSPLPVQWKGNVPKNIHHARIAKELEFEINIQGGMQGYGVPRDPKIKKMLPLTSDWKHGMDALGLALWARRKSQ